MRKKLLGILLICGMLITMVPFALPASAAEPTAITTADELAALMADPSMWSGDYILMSDIDLTGKTQAPIGNKTTPFTGTFDGNRHTVSGVDLTAGTEGRWGFFGCISGATIENLTVEGAIKSTGDGVGGIVGCIVTGGGTIRNCVNKCSVETTNQRAGGIIGVVQYTAANVTLQIENCKNYGAIKAPYAVGGIGGRLDCNSKAGTSITVKNCANYGTVTATQTSGVGGNGAGNAGGIIGTVVARTGTVKVENCYNHGSITGYEVGGMVAYFTTNNNDLFTVKNCLSDATLQVYNNGYVGGIAGYAVLSTGQFGNICAENCVVLGNIVGNGNPDFTHGVLGVDRIGEAPYKGPEIKNCYYASTLPIDEKAISVPEADLACEVSYPSLKFGSTWTMTWKGPMLTSFVEKNEDGKIAYISFSGKATVNGSDKDAPTSIFGYVTPPSTNTGALSYLGTAGGTIVAKGKIALLTSSKIAEIQNATIPASAAPIILTAVDPSDGTDYRTTGDNPDGSLKMNGTATLTIESGATVAMDQLIVIVEGSSADNPQIILQEGATLIVTDDVSFITRNGSPKLIDIVLAEGAVAYLSEAAQKWFGIINNGGEVRNYGAKAGLYGSAKLADDSELVYNGKEQAALVLPEGVTVKKSDAKDVGTYENHTVVLTADGYNDYTILVPETTITAVALTASDFRTEKYDAGYGFLYKLAGVVEGDVVWLYLQDKQWNGTNFTVVVALDGPDKDNYTLATTIHEVNVSATESKYTVKYFKDGKEVSEDTLEVNKPFPEKVEESDLEKLKKNYEGYELDSITDAEGNPIEAPLLVEGKDTVICYNYKTPGGEGGEGEESEQLKALKTVALVTTVRKNYVRNTTTTINFVTRGGERLPSITVRGGAVELPTPANKPGYTFGGWYMDTNCVRPYTANTALSGSVTLYAKWVKN